MWVTGDLERDHGWGDEVVDCHWDYDNVEKWIADQIQRGFDEHESSHPEDRLNRGKRFAKSRLSYYVQRWMAYFYMAMKRYKKQVISALKKRGGSYNDLGSHGFLFVSEAKVDSLDDPRGEIFSWGDDEITPFDMRDFDTLSPEVFQRLIERFAQRYPNIGISKLHNACQANDMEFRL